MKKGKSLLIAAEKKKGRLLARSDAVASVERRTGCRKKRRGGVRAGRRERGDVQSRPANFLEKKKKKKGVS